MNVKVAVYGEDRILTSVNKRDVSPRTRGVLFRFRLVLEPNIYHCRSSSILGAGCVAWPINVRQHAQGLQNP